MIFLLFSIGAVMLLTAIELRWPASTEPSTRLVNAKVWALYAAVTYALVPVVGSLATRGVNWLGGGVFDLASWPIVLGVLAFAFAMDFGEFLFHRAQHAIPFLWRMHSLHHSDPNMNATTAARHFWADPLIKAVTIWPAVGLLFKPTPLILVIYASLSLYHYFAHANLRVNFGRLSWVLNAPAYHRLHHSADPQDYGTNFAGLFPIFDLIFGSYRQPTRFVQTGLAERPRGLLDAIVWPAKAR